jgi:hypothetical protein
MKKAKRTDSWTIQFPPHEIHRFRHCFAFAPGIKIGLNSLKKRRLLPFNNKGEEMKRKWNEKYLPWGIFMGSFLFLFLALSGLALKP